MTRTIESIDIEVKNINQEPIPSKLILVRLDSLAGFDPLEFDELATGIGKEKDLCYRLKQVVTEGGMYCFSARFPHIGMAVAIAKILNKPMQRGVFLCAGEIRGVSDDSSFRRIISGRSESLFDYGLLRLDDSRLHKTTVLEPKLGQWFEVI